MVNGWISPRRKFRKFVRFGNCIEEIHESKHQLAIILKTEGGERERDIYACFIKYVYAGKKTKQECLRSFL